MSTDPAIRNSSERTSPSASARAPTTRLADVGSTRRLHRVLVAWLALCGGCSGDGGGSDAGDAGARMDATSPDAASPDAASPDDASAEDGGSALDDAAAVTGCAAISAPPGFSRTAVNSFQELRNTSGTTPGLFPTSGGAFVILDQQIDQYTSIPFTVPTDLECNPSAAPACRFGEFDWNTVNDASYLNVNNSYVTISECPGDFRIPTTADAPPDDPTFAQGCRNWRASAAGLISQSLLGWHIRSAATYTPSTSASCHLEPGKTYYFNLILDGPLDGVISTSGASTGCEVEGETRCGIGLLYYAF